jgi:ATP-dependent Clp protease ATP-binding subunit ClpC
MDEGEGVAAKVLEQLGVEVEVVRESVTGTVGVTGTAATGSPPFTPRAKRVLELSLREALQLGHNYIGTEHMLLGLVREGEGVGAQVLVSLGVNLPRVRQQVVELLESYGVPARVMTPEAESRRSRGKETSSIERVGREWSARVVRPGRTPPDYEAAYEELESLFEGLGIAVWG